MNSHKVIAANATSWGLTFFSYEFLRDALQVLALCGSICVSIATVWWIKRQAQSLQDRDDREKRG